MVELWYVSFGFDENPFNIKPMTITAELYGYDQILDKVIDVIESDGMCFIEGEVGTGKTSILKYMIDEFKGDSKIVYYNRARTKHRIPVERVLTNRYGWLGNLFKIKPKNMILLMDEVYDLDEEECEDVQYFYSTGNFKSVVLASTSLSDAKITKDLKKQMEIIKLKRIPDEDAVQIIEDRLGTSDILPKSVAEKIFKKADRNPRRFLEYCEDVCRHAAEQGDEKVAEKHLKVLNS